MKITGLNKLISVLLGTLILSLLMTALASFQWRMGHDGAIQYYMGLLIDRWHCIPYKDFYDINMPGTYVLYFVLGHTFGYSDFGARCADFLAVCIVAPMTGFAMREFGWKSAVFSACAFALAIYSWGPSMSLQRDFLQLVPLSMVLALVFTAKSPPYGRMRVCLIGLLFGFSATVKPQIILAFVVVTVYLVSETFYTCSDRTSSLRGAFWTAVTAMAGFVAPLAGMVWTLWWVGALPHFADIAANYWPLYNSLSGNAHLTGWDAVKFRTSNTLFLGGYLLLLAPAILGAYRVICDCTTPEKSVRKVWVLVALAVVFTVSVVSTGKFYPYHWFPVAYVLFMLSSLCIIPNPGAAHKREALGLAVILLLAVLPHVVPPVQNALSVLNGLDPRLRLSSPFPNAGDVVNADEIAGYLKKNLKPDDAVQALDWTRGAIHGMLLAQARTATPFIGDFMFYHHVSHPYILSLRERLLKELHSKKPRFIIEVYTENKPWITGTDTTKQFEELKTFIELHYIADHEKLGEFRIHRRRGD